MKIEITRTTPIYASSTTAGVFVQWLPTDVPANTPDPVFTLLRSGSPNGPFEVVAANLTALHYFDAHIQGESTLGYTSLQREVYYTVTSSTARSAATVVGDGLPKRQRLLRKKIQRDISVAFRVGSGIMFAVLPRRHWGMRCTVCFDKLTKSVANSKCLSCYGTGFVGGYHEPFHVMSRKGVTNTQVTTSPQGKTEVNQLDMTILDYPRLSVDDIIAELRSDRRYVIRHITRTELRGVPVHQRVILSELARDSVEYRIPISSGQTPTFY